MPRRLRARLGIGLPLVGIALLQLSCEPPAALSWREPSQHEFHFAAGPAVIAVAETVFTGGVRSEFIRLFLQGFDTLADSLRRAGYSVGLSLVSARDTLRVTLGVDSLRLTAGASAGYYLLAPGRAPYFYGSRLKRGEVQVALSAWARGFRFPEPPSPTAQPGPETVATRPAVLPSSTESVSIAAPAAEAAPRPCGGDDRVFTGPGPLHTRAVRPRGSAADDIEPVAPQLVFDAIAQGKVTAGYEAWPGYRLGVFRRGPYAGYDLVFATYVESPCKGPSCAEAGARFAQRGQELVYLPRLSSPCSRDLDLAAFVGALGFRESADTSYTDLTYSYPETLTGPKPGQTLRLLGESVYDTDPAGRPSMPRRYVPSGSPASDRFATGDVVFRDSVLGDVYTRDTVTFVVFRPDGTALEYRYFPDIGGRTVHWDGATLRFAIRRATGYGDRAAGVYVDATDPCDFLPDLEVAVKHPERELVPAGEIEGRGPIFVYRDSNAAFLRGLFDGGVFKHGEVAESLAPHPPSYHDFLAAKPLFFWRDPFGRLERFFDGRYRPPCMAEPILYLYPERRERVEVAVNIGGHIVAADPPYRRSWQVEADPQGVLTDPTNGTRYSHLYWEGWSAFVRTPERGFVVARAELPAFFQRILPRLGLSARETRDFARAWLPRLTEAPYYFITFLPPEAIERLAPLRVRPEPKTVIRVFMDYRPLRVPTRAIAPELPRAPQRTGFTVVEWGGLTRQ